MEHDAVCRHLGRMTPEEVASVRERGGFSQAEFAKLTRLGEATISRWERGALIQNAANDQLLYLLQFPHNVAALRERRQQPIGEIAGHGTFRKIQLGNSLIEEAHAFQLRSTAGALAH